MDKAICIASGTLCMGISLTYNIKRFKTFVKHSFVWFSWQQKGQMGTDHFL